MELSYKEIQELRNKARNKHTSSEVLISYATHEDRYVRVDLAKNPSIPRKAIEILLHDKDRYVVESLILHQQLTEEDYMVLVNNADQDIRFVIAQYSLIPHNCAKVLAKDPSDVVRYALALSITDKDILKELELYDSTPGVRAAAKKNLLEYEKYKRQYKGED